MKWKKLKIKYPYDRDSIKYLVSDGKQIWIGWSEKNEFFFISETSENEYNIEKRLTHWCDLKDIDLPKD